VTSFSKTEFFLANIYEIRVILINFLLLIGAFYITPVQASDTLFPHASLTPVGAEIEGNADGSIPRWQGEEGRKKQFENNLISENPLYSSDHLNVEKYKNQLPGGLVALINQYPETMKIPVYKSYRPAYYPDWVYQGIEKNVTSAELADNGDSVTNTYPGLPFPSPETGYHVLWNHLLTYRGVHVEIGSWDAVVFENRDYSLVKSKIKYAMEYYRKDRSVSKLDQIYMYYLSSVVSPSRLSGGGLLVHERVNGSRIPRQGWGYMAGQRRVVRIPSVDYDSAMPRSEGIRFADEVDLYNGSVNRYQWRLLGKKELIIPYNNEKLYKELEDFDDINEKLLIPRHLNSDFLRYEKHRVWVVEGVLKKGKVHPYKKRILYLDEDSWLAVLAENYDKKNTLWRVSVSYVKQFHTLPAVFKVSDAFHDLRERAYYVQLLVNDGNSVIKQEMPPKAMFKPTALRRLGRR